MPELPEVEAIRRGLTPAVVGRRVERVVVRDRRLRWPVSEHMAAQLAGHPIEAIERRAKYLLLRTAGGSVIVHLGMSGSLRVVGSTTPLHPHDHVAWELAGGLSLRLRDPRRFGAAVWTRLDPLEHPLLAHLGPEPLGSDLDGPYLAARARGRRAAVKAFLMDARIVAGVGNIYATEALHGAGIDPRRRAGRISAARYAVLAAVLKAVLGAAIGARGTTFRDYRGSDGEPGGYGLSLRAYGRAGQPCLECGGALRAVRVGSRASVFCPRCQR